MAIKGVIEQDHMPVNKYRLDFIGMTPALTFTFTKISGLEEELEVVELPDRTIQTGGRKKPVEFEATLPMHHKQERWALEAWLSACQDPVTSFYKLYAVLTVISQTGNALASYNIAGVFPTKRAMPDLELANEGDMAEMTWTFRADEIAMLM